MDNDQEEPSSAGNPSGEAIAATQQVGDERPSGVRGGSPTGADMDNPSTTGALDPDDPDVVNTAAGMSVGGTGAGIEPGVDADLGLEGGATPEETVAAIYDEPAADIDFDRTGGSGA